jgi:hypothetical protein
MQPPSWIQESALGDPQKNEPCGTTAAAPGTPTNVVTPFKAGQQITVQWAEEVAHDGWFRIAISYNNRADLKDPTVQVNAQQIAIDASVVEPPVLPILADHLFPHTAASVTTPKAYSYMVTLPMQPCAKCTLQLIQFMGDHGPNGSNTMNAAYIYHHCADISISASTDGGTPTDAGKDVSIGSGGSAGAGGASTGGGGTGNNGGAGGSTGAGGSSGTSTGGATGSTSTGSTVSTTTGPTGTTTTTTGSGAGGSSTSMPSSSDNGCSCRLASRTKPSMAALGALVGLALAARRRRQR